MSAISVRAGWNGLPTTGVFRAILLPRGRWGPRCSRILLLLTLALLPRWAQAQRIEPLGPVGPRQSKAQAVERVAASLPPSLRLNLPAPAAAALPPLGPDDLQRLRPQEGRPPLIGVHRRLPAAAVALSFADGAAKTSAAGAWQSTAVGRLWRLKTTSPGARALRIHFRDFAVGAGRVWLHSADGQTVGPYTGSGLYGDGDFWSGIVFGDSLTIEYLPDPAAAEGAAPFQIVAVSHIWEDAFGGEAEAGVSPPAAAAEDSDTGKAINQRVEWAGAAARTQSAAADDPRGAKKARLAKAIQSVERAASLQQPRPKAARRLTPGQSVSFRLGPVDSPTLFTGDHSFRLDVPDNASRVIFTLESVDPSVDMDLYVRFGEDNDIRNGIAVSDYSSRGYTGNEKITITRQSDPPLQDGTYYASLALYDTGAAAEGTLTAEVELDEDAIPTPEPTVGGGPLTPGQPAGFRLGPVDSPTLFTGDHSFRLEVPGNASRVIFTLESVDPSVDVDLYVRFGEDNDIRNGIAVSDYSSRGYTGNERIGITRRSNPLLRAGTYYASLVLYDTGAAAEGALTATVETDAEDCHLDVTCYSEWSSSAAGVARIVFEEGESTYVCSGTLLNNRRRDRVPYFLTAAHCVDTEAAARSVTAFWLYQTQTCKGDLPAFRSVPRTEGSHLLSTSGGPESLDGDMTLLHLAGNLPDGVAFQGWDAGLQPVGTQVTGIHHPENDDWGFFKRISFGQIIPNADSGTSGDTYAAVSYPVGQGYTEPGSSGSAIFSGPGTVVGTLSGGDIVGNACPTVPVRDVVTRFSAFYPRIRQFLDGTPMISSGGIVLATGTPVVSRISPNSLVTVYGAAFAPEGSSLLLQIDSEGKVATKRGDTCLEINGARAPLFAVFPNKINAQAPHNLAGGGEARVAAVRGCGSEDEQRSPQATVAAAPVSPAFFNLVNNPDGRNPVVAQHGDGPSLVGEHGLFLPGLEFTPAEPGEIVTLFGTGFGETEPRLEAGQIPSTALPESNGRARIASQISFTIGGMGVPAGDVTYAGAAPCCAGLYQFAVRVPAGVPDGRAAVSATVQGVSTPEGPYLAVHSR